MESRKSLCKFNEHNHSNAKVFALDKVIRNVRILGPCTIYMLEVVHHGTNELNMMMIENPMFMLFFFLLYWVASLFPIYYKHICLKCVHMR